MRYLSGLTGTVINLRRTGRSSGFTLIEIVIVISALLIVVALLLPVLSRAREVSYAAQCASNLRQLGAAFHEYALDWNGFWPSPGGLVGDRSYWSQRGNGGLYPYVKQRGLRSVWCCPLLREWHGQFPPRSYSMNSYLRTCWTPSHPEPTADMEYPGCINYLCGIHISAIWEPRATILLFEGMQRTREFEDVAYTEDQVYYIYRCANWTWVRGFRSGVLHTIGSGSAWHGARNNYLYCDGHVVLREPARWNGLTQLVSPNEMYEWYVDKKRFRSKFPQRIGQ
jgi:prepilin-type processing-associated H-X9-DG protein